MTKPSPIVVTVWFYDDPSIAAAHGGVVASCEEYDFVSQGTSDDDAVHNLVACMTARYHVDRRRGRPWLEGVGPIPRAAIANHSRPRRVLVEPGRWDYASPPRKKRATHFFDGFMKGLYILYFGGPLWLLMHMVFDVTMVCIAHFVHGQAWLAAFWVFMVPLHLVLYSQRHVLRWFDR